MQTRCRRAQYPAVRHTQRRCEEKICSPRPWRRGLESTFSPLLLSASDWSVLVFDVIEQKRDWFRSLYDVFVNVFAIGAFHFGPWHRGKGQSGLDKLIHIRSIVAACPEQWSSILNWIVSNFYPVFVVFRFCFDEDVIQSLWQSRQKQKNSWITQNQTVL